MPGKGSDAEELQLDVTSNREASPGIQETMKMTGKSAEICQVCNPGSHEDSVEREGGQGFG